MRILFVTSRLPYPPHRGDRLRTYNLLKHLSVEHSITLVTFITGENERVLARELSRFCSEIHLVQRSERESRNGVFLNAWRREPLQVIYYRSDEMQQTIDQILATGQYDVAYIHLFRMAQFLRNHSQICRILDLTDLISAEIAASLPFRSTTWRLLYQFEQPRIARYERQAAEWSDEVWFISERDRVLFADRAKQFNSQVVPNGIDEQLFQVQRKDEKHKPLVFLGNYDVPHNIDATRFLAADIMPLILRAFPDYELHLVGAGDLRSVEDLDRLPGVRVVGFVPDLGQLFARSSVFVAPLRFSAGIQNKVLEAMAAALPVVTGTAICAAIGAVPGEHLLVAEDPQEYATQTIRLIENSELNQRIGQNARNFVQNRFSWQTAVNRIRAIADQISS